MNLATFWFILIAILWSGYFVLEGFDFGVGILLPVLGRTDTERRVIINAIGPVWDGNEVWLLTAGGATFAAFPQWYATMFSGFYLPLLIILVALIVRGVCFEFRSKVDSPRWRANWDRAIFAGSALPALLWGVAFANIVRGVPVNAAHVYTGNLLTLLNWYGLLGGLVTLSLFTLHGAIFLGLKTTGELRARARATAVKVALVAVPAGRGLPGRHPVQPRPARHRRHRRGGRGRPDRRRRRGAARPGGLGLRRHRRSPSCWPSPPCSATCGRTCSPRAPRPRST